VAAPAFVLLGALAISETLDKAAHDMRTPEPESKGEGAASGSRASGDGGGKAKKGTK